MIIFSACTVSLPSITQSSISTPVYGGVISQPTPSATLSLRRSLPIAAVASSKLAHVLGSLASAARPDIGLKGILGVLDEDARTTQLGSCRNSRGILSLNRGDTTFPFRGISRRFDWGNAPGGGAWAGEIVAGCVFIIIPLRPRSGAGFSIVPNGKGWAPR